MSEALTTQINIRLTRDDLTKIDAYVERMGERTPGVRFTRTDAIRSLISQGLSSAGKKK